MSTYLKESVHSSIFDGLKKKHVDKARGGEVCTPPAITKQKSQVNYGFGGFIPLQHQRYR